MLAIFIVMHLVLETNFAGLYHSTYLFIVHSTWLCRYFDLSRVIPFIFYWFFHPFIADGNIDIVATICGRRTKAGYQEGKLTVLYCLQVSGVQDIRTYYTPQHFLSYVQYLVTCWIKLVPQKLLILTGLRNRNFRQFPWESSYSLRYLKSIYQSWCICAIDRIIRSKQHFSGRVAWDKY